MIINELIKAHGTKVLLALGSASETLRKKGVVDFGPHNEAHLKMRVSEAFRIAISPTTTAEETILLVFAILPLLINAGFRSLIRDFDRAIYEHLRNGGRAAVAGVIPEPPEAEVDLAERVLKALVILEEGGLL
jgi:hypothetical protein